MIPSLTFYTQTINFVYAIAGLVVLALALILLYDYTWNQQSLYNRYIKPYVWWIITVTTVGGVATTLLYSEILGLVPCSLCWLQRVALYPQALLVLAAWRYKDRVFFPLYGIILSVFGLLVAIYQYIYQAVPKELLENGVMPCLADGSADCSEKIMNVFGFVTFPFLSAVLFVFLIALYLHLRRSQ